MRAGKEVRGLFIRRVNCGKEFGDRAVHFSDVVTHVVALEDARLQRNAHDGAARACAGVEKRQRGKLRCGDVASAAQLERLSAERGRELSQRRLGAVNLQGVSASCCRLHLERLLLTYMSPRPSDCGFVACACNTVEYGRGAVQAASACRVQLLRTDHGTLYALLCVWRVL